LFKVPEGTFVINNTCSNNFSTGMKLTGHKIRKMTFMEKIRHVIEFWRNN